MLYISSTLLLLSVDRLEKVSVCVQACLIPFTNAWLALGSCFLEMLRIDNARIDSLHKYNATLFLDLSKYPIWVKRWSFSQKWAETPAAPGRRQIPHRAFSQMLLNTKDPNRNEMKQHDYFFL